MLLGKLRYLFGGRKINGCIVACAAACSAVAINEYNRSQHRMAFYRYVRSATGKLINRSTHTYPLYGKFRVDGDGNMWVRPVQKPHPKP